MLKKKRFWKKLCTVLLCLILCFTLVVNTCVDCFAVAGVDDGLFLLILTILASCGITFASLESAHHGVDAFTSSASSGTMDLINSKLGVYTAGVAVLQKIGDLNLSLHHVGISFLAEEWKKIIADVVAVFGTYTGIDALINYSSDGILSAGDVFKVSIPGISTSTATTVKIGNITANYIGGASAADVDDCVTKLYTNSRFDDCVYIVVSTAVGLSFANCQSIKSSVSYDFSENISVVESQFGNEFSSAFIPLGYTNGNLFFDGRLVSKDYISPGRFKLQYGDTKADVIVNGKLGDYSFGKSVCPDGIFTDKTWFDWLNDLIFGSGAGAVSGSGAGALPGNPGIDTTAYPNNDTWHDGSINDDVATGNPSIGISVPTDVSDDDIATLNPSKARDYSNADVKDKDVTTGDKDKPGDKDDDKKPSSKPSGLPSMTLPEILFKNKFPFCLPWDLYSLFVSLNATPKAPKFTIPFKNSRLNIDYEITIDISDYEMFAKLSRASLSVVFVVALILLSRKLIGAE